MLVSLNTSANSAPSSSAAVQKAAQPAAGAAQTTVASPSTQNSPNAAKPSPDYTVKISTAAQKALQEATESSVQTAQEASRGDLQAVHLQAKLAAEKQAQAG